MTSKKFNIIRHRGDLKRAKTHHQKNIRRAEKIMHTDGELYPTAPYDNHFLYVSSQPNQPAYMCTCGSTAVLPTDPPKNQRMFVCLFHATNGVHQTGEKRWV